MDWHYRRLFTWSVQSHRKAWWLHLSCILKRVFANHAEWCSFAYSLMHLISAWWRSCTFQRKLEHICRRLFLGTGLISMDQSHDYHDYQICLQLIFFLWDFLEGLVYEKHMWLSENLVAGIVAPAGCVWDMLSLWKCAIQCSINNRCVSMHLKRKKLWASFAVVVYL